MTPATHTLQICRGSESVAFDTSGLEQPTPPIITKLNCDGTIAEEFTVATEDRSTDLIDLESSRVIRYTSEGASILRFDVYANSQLAPLTTSLPGFAAFEIRTLPDGTALVADIEGITHVGTDGSIIATYTAAGESDWFGLALDPDAESFWAHDVDTGDIVRFDIATGASLVAFNEMRMFHGSPNGWPQPPRTSMTRALRISGTRH